MIKKVLPLVLFFLLATPAYAETASVSIKNSANTSGTNSTNTSTQETHIKIETNGKVTEYNSDKPGNVEVNSVNGESTIKVNGETVSGNSNSNPTAEPTHEANPTASVSPSPKPSEESKNDEKQNAIEEFIETVNEAIEKLFSVFH